MFERDAALYAALRHSGAGLYPELTFDDGHDSNLQVAAPILQKHGLTARFFITAGWTGKRPGFMDFDELRELLSAGHSIGAHGWSHKLLTHCSDNELETELATARLTLEDGLGAAVTTMSLPGGRANSRVLAACRQAGYSQIFTSEPKAEALPLGETVGRFNIRGDMQAEWLAELLRPESGVLRCIERQHRIKSLAKSLLGDNLYARLWALRNNKEVDAADQWDGGA
jgi:peptidoglycan/xylan/chitin deacetylase (PgdA/CDA1 family)